MLLPEKSAEIRHGNPDLRICQLALVRMHAVRRGAARRNSLIATLRVLVRRITPRSEITASDGPITVIFVTRIPGRTLVGSDACLFSAMGLQSWLGKPARTRPDESHSA